MTLLGYAIVNTNTGWPRATGQRPQAKLYSTERAAKAARSLSRHTRKMVDVVVPVYWADETS